MSDRPDIGAIRALCDNRQALRDTFTPDMDFLDADDLRIELDKMNLVIAMNVPALLAYIEALEAQLTPDDVA
jgi:hypothetical protein